MTSPSRTSAATAFIRKRSDHILDGDEICCHMVGQTLAERQWWVFEQYVNAALDGLDSDHHLPVLFNIRHSLELGLKLLIAAGEVGATPPLTHNLEDLLTKLPDGHRVHSEGYGDLRTYIAQFNAVDASSDGARYGTLSDGSVSMKDLCCESRDLARSALRALKELLEPLRVG